MPVLGTGGESGAGAEQGSCRLDGEDFGFSWTSRHGATSNANGLVSNVKRVYPLLLYV